MKKYLVYVWWFAITAALVLQCITDVYIIRLILRLRKVFGEEGTGLWG